MKTHDILRIPDEITVITDERTLCNKSGDFGFCTVAFDLKETLDVYLTADDEGIKTVKLQWNGKAGSGLLCLGDAWERSYGDLQWLPIEIHRHMPWYFYISDKTQTAAYGVRVRPAAICSWECFTDKVILTLDVRCGGMGIILKNRRLKCAEIVQAFYDNITPFKASFEFPKLMCSDGKTCDYPVYGSNNWYYAYGKITRESVLEDADYIAELTEGLENRPFMVIDDGWQKHRNALGPFTPNEAFGDMATLAAEIASRDTRPGLWTRLLSNHDEFPEEMKLKRPNTKGIYDPSHPKAAEIIKNDVITMRKWGYELLKHDYSTYDLFGKYGFMITDTMTDDSNWRFYNQQKTAAEIIIDFYVLVEEAFDGIVMGCDCIGHLCAGIHAMNRIGDDTSGKEWQRTLKMGVNTLAFRLGQHKVFFEVDADCIGITKAIDWKDNRKWLDLLARSGTPLFISSQKGVATADEVEEIKAAMARSSIQTDELIPLDWFDTPTPSKYLSNGEEIDYKF